jgi:hypothetical protein
MFNFQIKKEYYDWVIKDIKESTPERWITVISFMVGALATLYCYLNGYITLYGDAESHLNIAKRVIDSITPGFAQLGGVWLPLPHVLLIPFVQFDFLWKTGLAGSIISGIAFIVSSVYIYKLGNLLTKNKTAAFFGSLVFIFNPNILYMQSTPMTELILIVFFILSSYYFILFLLDDKKILNLVIAAFFGLLATLSRYDGWALVLMETGILFLYYFPYWNQIFRDIGIKLEIVDETEHKSSWGLLEGRLGVFCTLAFFGILIWFTWGYAILGDPLYFSHSQFSANSQQQGWLARGELPAYNNIFLSIVYYLVTSISNIGVLISLVSISGLFVFLQNKNNKNRILIILLLLVPLFFNVATLFMGQSIIFIPSLTPTTFEWTLFNVRYGVMMIPFAALCAGFLWSNSKIAGKFIIATLFLLQFALYGVGYSKVISYEDGARGLSSQVQKAPEAQQWLEQNYDYGVLLLDDYSRRISIIRTKIKMEDVIYIGNKPYWEESLVNPEKYNRWIVLQKGDSIWNNLWTNPVARERLTNHFKEVYNSDDILIFKKISD